MWDQTPGKRGAKWLSVSLSRERIKAGRLLRNGHKVCSLPAGCKEPERERAGGGEPDSEVRKQRHKEEKSSEVSMTFDAITPTNHRNQCEPRTFLQSRRCVKPGCVSVLQRYVCSVSVV